jgi:acetylornithine deacetylase
MMEQLIAIPSVSSTQAQHNQSNENVINLLANWLEDYNFNVSVQSIPDTPGKFNLVATLGQGQDGLVLAGHTDTVPFDAVLWDSDPFKMMERDGRLYGLGSCDMKSFFALVLQALRELDGKHLAHPVTILATADEESSMSGARALCSDDLHQSRFAVIGEPTSLQPVSMHKGIMMLAIRLQGSSGHSSNPALGVNALEHMSPVLRNIIDFRNELSQRYQHPAFEVSFPTLNLGCLHGGDNPNRICDHAVLEIDIRALPGMDNLELKEELTGRIMDLVSDPDIDASVDLLHPPVASFMAEESSPLLSAAERLTDRPCRSVAFATEAPFLKDIGLDTIVLGPGSIDQAHQPNEYIELEQLQPTIDIISNLVNQFCCKK